MSNRSLQHASQSQPSHQPRQSSSATHVRPTDPRANLSGPGQEVVIDPRLQDGLEQADPAAVRQELPRPNAPVGLAPANPSSRRFPSYPVNAVQSQPLPLRPVVSLQSPEQIQHAFTQPPRWQDPVHDSGIASDRQPTYDPIEDRIMTDVLLDIVLSGGAPDNSFKAEHWTRVAQAINGQLPDRKRTEKSAKNRHTYLKKNYYLPMKSLKSMTGAGWDEDRCEVLLDDAVWEALQNTAGGQEKYACKGRPWPLYNDWETIYQGKTATGGNVITPSRPTRNAQDEISFNGDSGDDMGSPMEVESDSRGPEGENSSHKDSSHQRRRSTVATRQEKLAKESSRLADSIEEMNRLQSYQLLRETQASDAKYVKDQSVVKIEEVYAKVGRVCQLYDLDEHTRDQLEGRLEGSAEMRDIFLACPEERADKLVRRILHAKRLG